MILWQLHRDAFLWITTDPENRDKLFLENSNPTPVFTHFSSDAEQIGESVEVLQRLSSGRGMPGEDELADACRAISRWAYEKGKFTTALAFAQNAALTAAESAADSHWVATIAARVNDHPRAEGWFRRALGLARRSSDWKMYSRSFSGLGNLYIRRGNLPAARRLHTRALRGARRGGMRSEQASALHDLFVVAIETGNNTEAEKLARQAFEAFGRRNRRLHILAHDVAYFWMENGHFARALPVFQAVLPLVDHEVERTLVLANLARAAGGAGERSVFNKAVDDVEYAISLPEIRKTAAARALLEVARGYLSLQEYDEAESAALSALASATANREAKVRFAAESVLGSIRERSATMAPMSTTLDSAPAEFGDQLAADFVQTLETIAGATT